MKNLITTISIICLCFNSLQGQEGNVSSKDTLANKEDKVYHIVEKWPEFPGGNIALKRYIANNIIYPLRGEICIEGKVYIRFIIDENGKVQNPKIARGVDPILDKEALRVISILPDFIPGEQNGKKVKVWYTIPVDFHFD